jgi:hypothetical protein
VIAVEPLAQELQFQRRANMMVDPRQLRDAREMLTRRVRLRILPQAALRVVGIEGPQFSKDHINVGMHRKDLFAPLTVIRIFGCVLSGA